MVTFKHFCNKPVYAAIMGYKFNIIDCISAGVVGMSFGRSLANEFRQLGRNQLIDVVGIAKSILSILFVFLMMFLYPVFGLIIYVQCKRYIMKLRYDIDVVDHWELERGQEGLTG